MAVTYVAASSGTNGNTTAAFTVAAPTGTQEGDLLVALLTSTTIYSPPTTSPTNNWTLIRDTTGNPFTSRFIMAWYHVVDATNPATYELRPTSGTPHSDAGGIICLRGADNVNPVDASSEIVNTVAGTSLVLTSITTTENGCMLVGQGGSHANATWTTGTMTERWDVKSAGSSPVMSVAATEPQTTAGATGTRTFTLNVSSTNAGILLAIKPGCIPIHPDPLFIPHKDRLARLAADFTDSGIARAIDMQFDNLKTIERWAEGFMHDTLSAEKCRLTIPFKNHSAELWANSARQSFDNWKAIERWASWIIDGTCGCNCTPEHLPDRCVLYIPYKDALTYPTDPTDLDALALAADREFDDFKTLERWAEDYASGDCGCTS